jgi:hypothetical protein
MGFEELCSLSIAVPLIGNKDHLREAYAEVVGSNPTCPSFPVVQIRHSIELVCSFLCNSELIFH